MVDKKGFSERAIALPFNWIFAIVVGGMIILLAVYGAVKFAGAGEKVVYTENAAKIVAQLENIEAGSGSQKAEINLGTSVDVGFDCSSLDNRPFGKQEIRLGSDDSSGSAIPIKDKYIFADNVKGSKLEIFTKPFYLGYKVSDLIIIYSGKYCFKDAPEFIVEGLEDLNLNDVEFDNCSGVEVCFSGQCDIKVDLENQKVLKNGYEVYYSDNLVFAAIFSSPEIYECNVKRLKERFNQLAFVYGEKIGILENKGCRSGIRMMLNEMKNTEVVSSSDLIGLIEDGERLNLLNIEQPDGCEVW